MREKAGKLQRASMKMADRNRLEGRTRMQRAEKVKRTVRRNVRQLYLGRAGNVKELKNWGRQPTIEVPGMNVGHWK